MKRMMVGTALMLVSLTAWAGKAERDYMTQTVEPAVKAAQDKFKSSCGCGLTIVVKDSIATTDDMYQAKHIAESITNGVGGYCTDAASKKAVCQMSKLEIQKGKDSTFTFKGGTGVSQTDGQSYMGWDQMTKVLDK